jgi:H+/gluconate symporter-like permease
VSADQLHRSVALASGALDAMPHNGYIVTTIRAVCGETHKAAYFPMAAMTVVVPLIGLAVAFAMFALGF